MMMTEHPRQSSVVMVGDVPLGGQHPVVIQAMTNTPTADIPRTVAQTKALANAGAELVRLTVNDEFAARAVCEIRAQLDDRGILTPLVGDFHFNGDHLLSRFPDSARALAKYRINPGTIGGGHKHDERFKALVRLALEHDRPVRIGTNWGSLDPPYLKDLMEQNASQPAPRPEQEVLLDALVGSTLRSAELAQRWGLPPEKIVLSAKVSQAPALWSAYRRLAQQSQAPLHLGLTEAGPGLEGIVASVAAIAPLLAEGIGDTVRISLTPAPSGPSHSGNPGNPSDPDNPDGARCIEVEVAKMLLQSLALRRFSPAVNACPGCGRTNSTVFSALANKVQSLLQQRAPDWQKSHPGASQLRVAVMGCVVNGPGESKHADIGISLPGTQEQPQAPVYFDGEFRTSLNEKNVDDLILKFGALIEKYVDKRWGKSKAGR